MSTSAALQAGRTPQPDLAAVKQRQQGAWSSGDYAVVGTTLQIVGEQLCEALDLRAGSKVLDVAAGNGNVTLAAARRWCDVDLDRLCAGAARARARARRGRAADDRIPRGGCRGAAVRRRQLRRRASRPSASCSRPTRTRRRPSCCASASPAARSASPTGRRRASSASSSRRSASICRRRPGVKSPALWGTQARLEEMFGSQAAEIAAEPRMFVFRYRSPEHWLDVFKTFYGPMLKAFAALDATGQAALRRDLLALLGEFNRAEDGTMRRAQRISGSRHHQALNAVEFGQAGARPDRRHQDGAAAPTVSAETASRVPSGLGCPVVVSRRVCRSISEFSSAPNMMTIADIHIHIIRPIAAPSEP